MAWRSIQRNKLYSSINVLGLTVGVSSCLVIFLIVKFELSFDEDYPGRNRIYRVYSQFSGTSNSVNRGVPAGMAAVIKMELGGLEVLTGFHTWSVNVHVQNKTDRSDFGRQDRVLLCGPEFFDVFNSYKWLEGDPLTSLTKPFQVVLTESQAKTYFKIENAREAMGWEIHYRDSLTVTVSGIVKDVMQNTDLDFTDFISLSTSQRSWLKGSIRLDDWQGTNSSSMLFVKLLPRTAPSQIEQGLAKLATKYMQHDAYANVSYKLQPLSDLHFNANLEIFDHSRPAASIPILRVLVIIAFLLLTIACVNFINLETAQAVRRAKEVGLRKVMGSSRTRLTLHFLMQSALLTGLAILISLPLVFFSLSFFSDFIPSGVQFHLVDCFVLFLILVGVTFLAGFYPAFSLSSVAPVAALKSQISDHSTLSGSLRKGLIIFQFSFAQILILATIIVGRQINYMLNKDLGFAKDAIIYFNAPWWEEKKKVHLLKNELEKLSEIEAISLNNRPPASTGWNASTLRFNNGRKELQHNVYLRYGDTSYIHVFGMKLLCGRNVHRSDTVREFIVNEAYSKLLGFENPVDALGNELYFGRTKFPIVGVIKDFHFQSLHTPIKPTVIADAENDFNCFGIKLADLTGGGDFQKAIEKINESWKKIYPDQKLDYEFMDEAVRKFYEKEERIDKLIRTATTMGILISCMGLFGLASFTASQRTKELGIRKILGGTPGSILVLLSKEFLVLILIAFTIAAPVAYFASEKWLEQFAYRAKTAWWVFPLTAAIAIFIAITSVSYQAIKAAFVNPSESLRCE